MMYRLDAAGRLAPRSIDVSRAAARRHEHLSALDRRPANTDVHPVREPRRWLRLALMRLRAAG